MLTLHGFPFSNYHNIVKHALMHKQIPFEEHIVYPNSPEMMAVTPTGKAPAMTTEKGTTLSESSVLVEYLEDAYPEVPLYPSAPDARGKVRQIKYLFVCWDCQYFPISRSCLLGLCASLPHHISQHPKVHSWVKRGPHLRGPYYGK